MQESILTILEAKSYILGGAGETIKVVFWAMAFGFILGLPLAVGECYGPSWLRRTVRTYVWFFRGVPILVLLYLFYFGLSYQIGYDIRPISAACIVLGLTSAAYQSQIYRGAISALPAGQLKAARALGMSDSQAILSIILPQAIRLSIPGFTNEYSILLKDSALVSVVGTLDLMARTKAIATSTGEYIAFYAAAAFLYFLITFFGVRGLRLLEKKLYIPGYTPV